MFQNIIEAMVKAFIDMFPKEVKTLIEFVDLAREKKSSIEILPIYEPITSLVNTADNSMLYTAISGWRYFVRLMFITKDGEQYIYDRSCGSSYQFSDPISQKKLLAKMFSQAKIFRERISMKWPDVPTKIIEIQI